MSVAAAAALLAAALAAAPPAAGQKAPPAGAIHWSFPEQVSARALGSPDGSYQLSLPWELALAGERLTAVVSSLPGHGAGGTLVFIRDGQGPWQELVGVGAGSAAGALVPAGGELALLTNGAAQNWGGAAGGLQLSMLPAAGAKVRLLDVYAPKVTSAELGGRNMQQIPAAALAARGGGLFAAFWLVKSDLAGSSTELCLRSSTAGGATWQEPPVLVKSRDRAVSEGTLALWAAKDDLHLLYSPLKEGHGTDALKHVVSSDGGATWQPGAPPEGPKGGPLSSLTSARVFLRGLDVYLVALCNSSQGGNKYWLGHSPDGGASWDQPRPIVAWRTGANLMANAHLAAGDGLLVFGHGWRENDGKAGGELSVSRDGGASWQKLDFAAGLSGQAFGPRAAVGPDGAVHVLFGWSDGAAPEMTVLYRRTLAKPEGGLTEAERAAVAALVRDLAADDYRAREKAAAGLLRYGPAVMGMLRAAAGDADAERSLAAETLLRKVKPAWWKD